MNDLKQQINLAKTSNRNCAKLLSSQKTLKANKKLIAANTPQIQHSDEYYDDPRK